MYTPPAFAMEDREAIFGVIEANPFGVLVTVEEGRPFATHLPFLLDRGGALLGHLARANPQWRGLAGGEAMAVFTGPHAYVSPAWYEAENVVPTWNYVAAHVYGRCRLVEGAELVELLLRSVQTFDRSGWRGNADEFTERLAKGVVGFRLEMERLEGKWKLSQNQPLERQERVIRALEAEEGEGPQGVAALMRGRLGAG
jgi:transcriptional regulator